MSKLSLLKQIAVKMQTNLTSNCQNRRHEHCTEYVDKLSRRLSVSSFLLAMFMPPMLLSYYLIMFNTCSMRRLLCVSNYACAASSTAILVLVPTLLIPQYARDLFRISFGVAGLNEEGLPNLIVRKEC